MRRALEKLQISFGKIHDPYFYVMPFADIDYKRANANLRRDRIGWHYIGPGTKVLNGVYVPDEDWKPAVKVDYPLSPAEIRPEVYDNYNKMVIDRMTNKSGYVNKLFLPKAAYDTVRDTMELSSKPLVRPDGSTSDKLSEFMIMNEGEALHLTLACAALIDMNAPGVLTNVETGKRVTQTSHWQSEEVHTWVRYEEQHPGVRRVHIIDPVKGFCGTLEDSVKKGPWDYRRTEDMEPRCPDVPLGETAAEFAIVSLVEYRRNKEKATSASKEVD